VFASRDPTARRSGPLRTSSSISGAKAKKLTLRHPMNNSHSHVAAGDPSQAFYVLYHTNANPLDRQNDQIGALCERREEPIQNAISVHYGLILIPNSG
jgi:hypothetical protein